MSLYSKVFLILQFILIIQPIYSVNFPTTENGEYDLSRICGKTVKRKSKIVGGEESYPHEFPWVVNIKYRNKPNSVHCGGVLISNQFILTAAHCLASRSPKAFTLRLGAFFSFDFAEEGVIELPISRYYIHEGFNPSTYLNDIALIKIVPINFTDQIIPICLPTQPITNYLNALGTIAGWGRLDSEPLSKLPNTLQKVEVPIISTQQCESWFRDGRHYFKFTAGQFCAGYLAGGKDACYGDSGSPYMIRNRIHNQMEALGLVSAGYKCANPKTPGVYTNIFFYLDWIHNNMNRILATN